MKRKTYIAICISTVIFMLLSMLAVNKTASAISHQQQIALKYCIVIDAGHGGEDGGAISCTGIAESQINLDIALRLEDLLHLLGYRTIMIRRSDSAVHTNGSTIAQRKASDLKNRVKIVSQTQNPILISIHQNMFPESKYSGAQVFYSQNAASKALAEQTQAALVESVNPGSRRKAKLSKGVYLMDQIQCPGILVECGFLSNPTEEILLRTPEYQKKLCCVLASNIGVFLDLESIR